MGDLTLTPDEQKAIAAVFAVVVGVARPTTAAGKAALGEQFAQRALREAYVDYVAQKAAEQARQAAGSWSP